MSNSLNGVVNYGMITATSVKYGVCKRSVHIVWASNKSQMAKGKSVSFESNKVGIPHFKTIVFDKDKMQRILFEKRTTIRNLAFELKMSPSHVGRWVKSRVIKPHTNAIKPELTLKNKLQRIQLCLSSVVVEPESQALKFSEMYDVIHIDEKWFYMTKNSGMYYLVPGETEPHRTCKSKRFIPNVMFMCAVCRPRTSSLGDVEFDGKIGIWPFTQQVPAQRNSKNRQKGTMITKPIESVTKDVIKACILNQIIPAIKAKWPSGASKTIYIQQDNARPHISNEDLEFRAAATADGYNIKLVCQPPNSPHTNINDLGWFRAIQSIQVSTASYNVDALVMNVLLSYEKLHPATLNNVFLSLKSCMIEILKAKGENSYKLQHMGKSTLIREGRLPTSLLVDEVLIRESIQTVREGGNVLGLSYDIQGLLSSLGY